jgi:hypothetical protein
MQDVVDRARNAILRRGDDSGGFATIEAKSPVQIRKSLRRLTTTPFLRRLTVLFVVIVVVA